MIRYIPLRSPPSLCGRTGAAPTTEGVFIVSDVAFIGSYCTSDVATIDLSGLPGRLTVLRSIKGDGYENMVSGIFDSSYNLTASALAPPRANGARRPLFAASYAAPGGLVIFDADAMASGGAMTEVGRLITHNTSRANRMHLRSDWQLALLPLEKSDDGAERGGVAIVDVADPAHPRLVLNQSIPNVASRAYTLASRGSYVYVFGAQAQQMYVYQLER